jgi:hypothetical protein
MHVFGLPSCAPFKSQNGALTFSHGVCSSQYSGFFRVHPEASITIVAITAGPSHVVCFMFSLAFAK